MDCEEIADFDIIVNGKNYGSLLAAIQVLEDRLGEMPALRSCTTHGDEHAKNVMVYIDQLGTDSSSWVIVDYPKASRCGDWVFSVAKMLKWWELFCALENLASAEDPRAELGAHVDFVGQARRIDVEYDRGRLLDLVPQRGQRLATLTREFASDFGEDDGTAGLSWEGRVPLALFSSLMGSAPLFVGRQNHFVPVLIGEALMALYGGG